MQLMVLTYAHRCLSISSMSPSHKDRMVPSFASEPSNKHKFVILEVKIGEQGALLFVI